MKISPVRAAAILSLVVIAATGSTAFAQQQAEGRVISSTPLTMADGSTAYAVTYDYNGSRYTTRTATPPGATIALQVDGMGVTTVEGGGNGSYGGNGGNGGNGGAGYAGNTQPAAPAWQNVTPEPGVVVSGTGAPPAGVPVYAPSAPVYVQPAPVYVQPAPVYVAPGYGYGYGGYGYAYPPVGVSLNFGYSRGWGGGYYRHGWH